MNKTIIKLKEINSSIYFLLASVFLSLSSVTYVVYLLGKKDVFAGNDIGSLNVFGNSLDNNLAHLLKFTARFQMVMNLLLVISLIFMWVFFLANKSQKEKSPITGLGLFQTVKVFEFIVLLAGFVYVFYYGFISLLDFFHNLEQKHEVMNQSTIIVGSSILVAYILLLVLSTLYFTKVFTAIRSLRMTLMTGTIMGSISLYVVIAQFVIALLIFAGVFVSKDVIFLISDVLLGLSFASFGVHVFKLRKAMRYISTKGGENLELNS